MNTSHRVIARSRTAADLSDAIVVSFSADWYKKLKAKEFSAIIRRRVPATMKPDWLYFHMNSPISAICARARVRSVEKIRRQKALSISDAIALSKDEIDSYIANSEEIGVYCIAHIELAQIEASVSRLNDVMVYHPPQSFSALSVQGKRLIDRMCQFTPEHDIEM